MAMTISTDGRKKAEINVTPMIDILLVLIIIFMVITPLAPRGLPEETPSSEIVVSVRADGTLLLNSEVLDSASLRARLERLSRNAATRVIFVRGGVALMTN